MNFGAKIFHYCKHTLTRVLDLGCSAIKPFEKKIILKFSALPLRHQPIFIIGSPRTGSTLLYQIVTNQFEVLFFDNLVCRLNKIPLIGFWISQKIFNGKAHNSFKSYHGSTIKFGLNCPSECGAFWYRWLPKERHFIDYEDFDEITVQQIRNELVAISNCFNKPLVFKNLNAGQRLRLLKECFPAAKFIYIKRDPLFVAQSILEAKRRLNLKDSDFWSIRPANFKDLEKMNCYEQIVKQIFFLEKQIEQDLKLFDPTNVLSLDYRDLAENFDGIIDKCKNFIGARVKSDFLVPKIELSERIRLSQSEIDMLVIEIEKLGWDYK